MPEILQPDSPRIRVLPEILINQIAAGEVVERPASILKELVENSLDAGATRIEVRLWQGGLERIQILDNGGGMSPADLALCLTRHATSKIQSLEDLEAISTFGFRGEALASIAAVSRIEIRSRVPESSTGYSVDADFGLMKAAPRPVACPAGTSITVEGLFEKLPARQKFMRSPGTESSHCSRILKEIAAGNAQTQFFLSNPEKKVLEFVTSSRTGRFKECFRPHWEPMCVEEENDEARLEAYLVPPHVVQDRGEIWFYVNRRPIKNRGLLAAVRQAYLSTLGPHHEPSGAVFLDIRRDWVDVNVHPQKTEVRCYRQESLFPWILSTIKKAIGHQRTLYSISSGQPSAAGRPGLMQHEAAQSDAVHPGVFPSVSRPQASPLQTSPSQTSFTTFSSPASPVVTEFHVSESMAKYPLQYVLPSSPDTMPPAPSYPSDSVAPISENSVSKTEVETGSVTDTQSPSTESAAPAKEGPWLRYLGQIKASYLVCESNTGLVLVDQHALHEKVRTEELKRRYSAGNLAVQTFLLPKVLALPVDLLPLLEEHASVLTRFGFEIERFGDHEAVLRSRPELIAEEDCGQVIEQVLREIAAQRLNAEEVLNQALHLLLATMACHSAIRANHWLSPLEAQNLLNQLDRLELGWTCPHGRPILFELSYQEIEHHFERA